MFKNGGEFSRLQKEVINKLARIEKEDAEACASCGGEDCACCEIYHDRQKWVSADELFDDTDDYYDYSELIDDDDDDDEYEGNMHCDTYGICDPRCRKLLNNECDGY